MPIKNMDYRLIENIILYGLSFFVIFVVCTLLLLFCIRLQKRCGTFSIIGTVWNATHNAIKILVIVISISTFLFFIVHSGKWPAASVWSFQGLEKNDFERFYLSNLTISTTCAKQEKELAREIFKYKTGISSIADVRIASRKLHQALKSQGYHEYYIGQVVELKVDSFYDKIRPL